MSRKVSRGNILSNSFSDADYRNEAELNAIEDPITALMNASGGGFNRNNNSTVLDKFRLTPPIPATNTSLSSTTGSIPTASNVSNDLASLQRQQIGSGRSGSNKMVCGSQYRMPQRNHTPCDNCSQLTVTNKKHKETIRTLKLQITRLEEQLAFMNKGGGKMPSIPTPMDSTDEITQLKAAISNRKRYHDAMW
jgi:hypothetical protein